MDYEFKVDELIENIDELRKYDDVMIRTRKINEYGVLFTLHGKHVIDYISSSLLFRANDPYSFSNEVTEHLFNRIFLDRYRFCFNNHIKVEKKLLISKLKEMKDQGYDLDGFINKFEKNEREFFKFEIDAELQLETIEGPVRRFENKLITCPDQSGSVLIKYLFPEELRKFFAIRDYLGIITFANLHEKHDKNLLYAFPETYPVENRYEWLLHFVILDRRIMLGQKSAKERANEILHEFRADHQFFMEELELNSDDCSISLIENYVKVVNLLYMIEDLKVKNQALEGKNQVLERQIEEERKKRLETEKKRLETEKKLKIMEEALKKAGLESPLDDDNE